MDFRKLILHLDGISIGKSITEFDLKNPASVNVKTKYFKYRMTLGSIHTERVLSKITINGFVKVRVIFLREINFRVPEVFLINKLVLVFFYEIKLVLHACFWLTELMEMEYHHTTLP